MYFENTRVTTKKKFVKMYNQCARKGEKTESYKKFHKKAVEWKTKTKTKNKSNKYGIQSNLGSQMHWFSTLSKNVSVV